MTLASNFESAGTHNEVRLNSEMDLPLNQLEEVNESAQIGTTFSNENRVQDGSHGCEILIESGSRNGSRNLDRMSHGGAAEEMLEQ